MQAAQVLGYIHQRIRELLGDGSQLGLQLSYAEQDEPRGPADAFIVGRPFVQQDSICLVLGDSFFYGSNFRNLLQMARTENCGATVFGYRVGDPRRFGVVEFDDHGNVLSLEEKPREPRSH